MPSGAIRAGGCSNIELTSADRRTDERTHTMSSLSVQLTSRLEASSWCAEDIGKLMKRDHVGFFQAAKESFSKLTAKFQARLLTAFSMMDQELTEEYAQEILEIVGLATEAQEERKKRSLPPQKWVIFASRLASHVAHKKSRLCSPDDRLLEEDYKFLLSLPASDVVDLSFCPREFMYMETNTLPPAIAKCAARDKWDGEKHFSIPVDHVPRASTSRPQTAEVDIPLSTGHPVPSRTSGPPEREGDSVKSFNPLKRKQRKQMQRWDGPDVQGESTHSPSKAPPQPSAAVATAEGSASDTKPTIVAHKSLPEKQQSDIETLMRNADPNLLDDKKRALIRQFMVNPKNPGFKGRKYTLYMRKVRISETHNKVAVLVVDFGSGRWRYFPKKLVQRKSSTAGSTPISHSVNPSPSPPIRSMGPSPSPGAELSPAIMHRSSMSASPSPF